MSTSERVRMPVRCAERYDYMYILQEPSPIGKEFTVKGVIVNGYPKHSVLAGQDMICFVNSYRTLEEAQEAYPTATISSVWTEPQNSFDHLPGDDDPDPYGDDRAAWEEGLREV